MCISQARIRLVFMDIRYLQALVHKFFLRENQAENPCQWHQACIHVHAETSDIYAVFPFTSQYRLRNYGGWWNNRESGRRGHICVNEFQKCHMRKKYLCYVILCADRVANTNPHKKNFLQHYQRVYYAPVHVKMYIHYSHVAINHASHLWHILRTR